MTTFCTFCWLNYIFMVNKDQQCVCEIDRYPTVFSLFAQGFLLVRKIPCAGLEICLHNLYQAAIER